MSFSMAASKGKWRKVNVERSLARNRFGASHSWSSLDVHESVSLSLHRRNAFDGVHGSEDVSLWRKALALQDRIRRTIVIIQRLASSSQ